MGDAAGCERLVGDLRREVSRQRGAIRSLRVERERLTRELAARLCVVEAQLRREQLHIEKLLAEKDAYIRFQALQIRSLGRLLQQVDKDCRPRTLPLEHGYSSAMADLLPLSRARPAAVQPDHPLQPDLQQQQRLRASRAKSLPELRLDSSGDSASDSDSLDSGISSPSSLARPRREESIPIPSSPRRSSSIGSFLNRTFSSSSSHLEKLSKDSSGDGNRRHSHSFSSGIKTNGLLLQQVEQNRNQQQTFISSASRTFGTNHRSVTKPRDIKFRKLFKFRRRAAEQEAASCEQYVNV